MMISDFPEPIQRSIRTYINQCLYRDPYEYCCDIDTGAEGLVIAQYRMYRDEEESFFYRLYYQNELIGVLLDCFLIECNNPDIDKPPIRHDFVRDARLLFIVLINGPVDFSKEIVWVEE